MVVHYTSPYYPTCRVCDASGLALAPVVVSAHPKRLSGDVLIFVKQMLLKYHAQFASSRFGESGSV